MNKKTADRLAAIAPDAVKVFADYCKKRIDESGQELLSDGSGTLALLIKFFAQDKIDEYFQKKESEKLNNFGFGVYLEAAIKQAGETLESIKFEELPNFDGKSIYAHVEALIQRDEQAFSKDEMLSIFTPKYHPAVIVVREKSVEILQQLGFDSFAVSKFRAHFNENIEALIRETFGQEAYGNHLSEVKKFKLRENEAKLLTDIYSLAAIGFSENENLEYEETFASWAPVNTDAMSFDYFFKDSEDYEIFKKSEESLRPAESLVSEYFASGNSDSVNKILFIIADFGKGKTVFMRHLASKMAKAYLTENEGFFPVYFNLRNFSKYSSSGTFGVLGDYLLCEYGIRVEDEHFKKKKYLFLVDSLDESGELSKQHIDKVIQSIKSIQNIDKEFRRNNRIIISSRPFSDGFEYHLKAHEPFEIKDQSGKSIPHFISLYGFKAEQFNHWLLNSLGAVAGIRDIQQSGLSGKIVKAAISEEYFDAHSHLFQNKTLSLEELKRPIFAYMIFQLIIHNINFLGVGKIGVYLSFLNLLTKEAKHISDKDYEVNAREEINYRNILHYIASLWTFERQKGKQGVLRKADICRVLEGKENQESDRDILERFNKRGVNEIEFLSHSYFGENNDLLHFQHQSFAEILLAEYYLKVFIKFALEKQFDIDQARSKLSLGEPTVQTISFLKELLVLFADCAVKEATQEVIEKRRLLLPLLISMTQNENNTLFSNDLYYNWFLPAEKQYFEDNNSQQLLENWAIDEQAIRSILHFSAEIINSNKDFLVAKSEPMTALFNKEVTSINLNSALTDALNMDKWIALVVGNLLGPQEDGFYTFNRMIKSPLRLIEMLKLHGARNRKAVPFWAKDYFQSMNFPKDEQLQFDLGYLNLSGINFSNSNLIRVRLDHCNLASARFENCFIEGVTFAYSDLMNASFDRVNFSKKMHSVFFTWSIMAPGVFLPIEIFTSIIRLTSEASQNFLDEVKTTKTFIRYAPENQSESLGELLFDEDDYFFRPLTAVKRLLKGLLQYGLNEEIFDKEQIKSWFEYKEELTKIEFEQFIDDL